MRRKLITSAVEYARQAQTAKETHDRRWTERVCVDPSILNEVLDRFPDLAWEVTQNPDLPDDVAVRLSRWPSAFVRGWVARRERLPRQAIDTLLRDIGVSRSLAGHVQAGPEDLATLLDNDPGIDINGDYLYGSASHYLKYRFATHWRDVAPTSPLLRLSPYEDPADMTAVLRAKGYKNLDPLNPLPDPEWFRACEDFDDPCDWLSYAGYTSEEMFAAMAGADGWETPEAAANSPHCPPKILSALAFDWDVVVRSAVATNPSTDLPTLLYLASDDWREARSPARGALDLRFGVRLGKRRTVLRPEPERCQRIQTADEFFRLSRSPDPIDRARTHFGPICEAVIGDLDNSQSDYRDLLWNMTMPIDRIQSLKRSFGPDRKIQRQGGWWFTSLLDRPDAAVAAAQHPDPEERGWAAFSDNTTEEALLLLAQLDRETLDWRNDADEVADNARSALCNLFGYRLRQPGRKVPFPRTQSVDQFISLCRSDHPLDREKATTQGATYPTLWREVLERAPELAKWVAINETVGPRLLDELADWPDPEVRRWVCDHPRVWLKTLDRLAFEADPSVRRRAVYNSRLSNQQLKRLRHDVDAEVAAEAKRRMAAREYANRLLNGPEWWRHLGNSEIV